MPLSEVARELSVARSTAHRLLGTLIGRGFAIPDEQRRYCVRPAISTLLPVAAAPDPGWPRALVNRYLRSLSKRAGETERGLTAVGMRIRGGGGNTVGAVSISAPSIGLSRGQNPEVANVLRESVNELEAALRDHSAADGLAEHSAPRTLRS